VCEISQTRAAPALGDGDAEQALLAEGGPQVARIDGPNKPKKLPPDILKRIAEEQSVRDTIPRKDEKTLRSLIRLWRSENPNRPSSPEWEKLAVTTKKTWGAALDAIEAKWGDVPLTVFNDARMKAKIVEWRDSRAATPRGADIGVTVLKSLLKFGTLRGKVLINVAEGVPALCGKNHADRAEIIWTTDDLLLFEKAASELDSAGVPEARREAGSLLSFILGKDRTFLISHAEDETDENSFVRLREFVERRAAALTVCLVIAHFRLLV